MIPRTFVRQIRKNEDSTPPLARFGLVLVACLLVTLPRLWHLENRSLWFDEAASWRTSSFELGDMLRSLAGNVHAPVYYIVLKAWSGVWGDSPTALRSCSAVWGIIAAVLAGAVVRAGSGERWRLPAYMVVAVYGISPLAVRYSREAVMYTLATSLVLGSAWLFLIAQARKQTRYLWISTALITAGVYTHYYVLLHALAHAFLVVWHASERRFWTHVLIAALPFLLFAPWAPTFWGQLRLVDSAYWIAPLTWERAGSLLWQLWAADDGEGSMWRAVLGWASIAVAVIASWRWGDAVGRLAAVHFVMAVALAFGASVVWRSVVMPRYFAPAHALLVCGVVAALRNGPVVGRVLSVVLLGNLLVLLVQLWPHLDPGPSHGLQSAVSWVGATRSAGDVVLVNRPFLFVPWKYYDRDGQVYLTAHGVDRLSHYEGLPLLSVDERQSGEQIGSTASTVWFVHGTDRATRPEFLNTSGWVRTGSRRFSEAFSWQSPVLVDRYERASQ